MATQPSKPVILYEEAAERVNAEGWMCLACRRWYGEDERAARWCCATDLPCDCGKRRAKKYSYCEDCGAQKDAERWAAKERREWDGETALYSEELERFIFDAGELEDELIDSGLSPEELRLVFCRPAFAQELDADDYWADELPEDCTLEDTAPDIAEAVEQLNAVIRARNADEEPLSWWAGEVVAVIPEKYLPKD